MEAQLSIGSPSWAAARNDLGEAKKKERACISVASVWQRAQEKKNRSVTGSKRTTDTCPFSFFFISFYGTPTVSRSGRSSFFVGRPRISAGLATANRRLASNQISVIKTASDPAAGCLDGPNET